MQKTSWTVPDVLLILCLVIVVLGFGLSTYGLGLVEGEKAGLAMCSDKRDILGAGTPTLPGGQQIGDHKNSESETLRR